MNTLISPSTLRLLRAARVPLCVGLLVCVPAAADEATGVRVPTGRAVDSAGVVGPATRPAEPVEAQAVQVTTPVTLSGVFQPAEPVEIKLDFKSFAQPLPLDELAGHGTEVSEGDVLLAVDAEKLDRALASARSRLSLAEVTLSKARTDADIAEQSDALAARVARRRMEDAQANVSWFESTDGEAILRNADIMVERARDSIEDQEDELEQLRRMYKSEELTEDTADLVIKRALRRLRQSKDMLDLTEKRATKVRENDFVSARQNLVDALDAQKLAFAQLENDQMQRKAARDAAMVAADEGFRVAREAVDDLEADLDAARVKAPRDGVLLRGQIRNGIWTPVDEQTLEPGRDLRPGQIVATFVGGDLALTVELPENQRFSVSEGDEVEVKPEALPGTTLAGRVKAVAPIPTVRQVPGQPPIRQFRTDIELTQTSDRLRPGFTASVEIRTTRELPAVPAAYLSGGVLRVERDGEVSQVTVSPGAEQDGLIPLTAGAVSVGDRVLPPEMPAVAAD